MLSPPQRLRRKLPEQLPVVPCKLTHVPEPPPAGGRSHGGFRLRLPECPASSVESSRLHVGFRGHAVSLLERVVQRPPADSCGFTDLADQERCPSRQFDELRCTTDCTRPNTGCGDPFCVSLAESLKQRYQQSPFHHASQSSPVICTRARARQAPNMPQRFPNPAGRFRTGAKDAGLPREKRTHRKLKGLRGGTHQVFLERERVDVKALPGDGFKAAVYRKGDQPIAVQLEPAPGEWLLIRNADGKRAQTLR